uniref:Uncharacterized protein n=1 Tax=Hyaloperonospora arabidopsidis (strain Emoy2) TaxID=559515 RepID=M4B4Y1_HYAAE
MTTRTRTLSGAVAVCCLSRRSSFTTHSAIACVESERWTCDDADRLESQEAG